MAKTISSLSVALGASIAPLNKSFSGAAASVAGLKESIGSTAGTLLAFTGVGAAVAAGMGVVKGVFGSVGDSISLASSLEQNQVAFETMTGSATKAADLMRDIGTFAAETPFEFPELASSAKKLLAFGTTADQLVPTMRALGDISSGIDAPLNEISELFGKAKVQGTLMAEDINQLVGRGIPVIQQFAKQLGVSEGEVESLASKGQINFGMLQQAVADMTGEGGQFAGMMAKQSQTLGGLWSTLTDNIGMSMAGMVTKIVDAFRLKAAIASLAGFVGTAGAWMQSAVGTIAAVLMRVGEPIVSTIGGIFGGVYAAVAPVVTGVYNFLAVSWGAIAGVASTAFTAVYDTVAGVMSSIYTAVAPVVTSVAGVVAAHWLPMVASVIGYYNSIFNVISSTLSAAWSIVQTIAAGIGQAWTWAMDLIGLNTDTAASSVSGAFGGIMKAAEWLQDTVSLAFNVLAYGIKHFDTVIAAAMTSSAYEVVRFGNEVTYFFADVIPGYLAWFGRNWTQVFTDAATMTGTIFANLSSNVGNFFSALWSAMKGDGFDFKWTGLTEGFESAITELPKIAERQVGPMEQVLGQTADALNADLSQGLGQFLNDQDAKTKAAADAIKRAASGMGQSITAAAAGAGATAGAALGDETALFFENAVPDAKMKIDTKEANKAIDKTKDKAADLKTVVAGSAESLQMQAQAQFAAMVTPGAVSAASAAIAPPQAAPVADWQAADRKQQDKAGGADSDMATLLALVIKYLPELPKITAGVAKPAVRFTTATA